MSLKVIFTGVTSPVFAPVSARISCALRGASIVSLSCKDILAGAPGVTMIGGQSVSNVLQAGSFTFGTQPAGIYRVCYSGGAFIYYTVPLILSITGATVSYGRVSFVTCVWDGTYVIPGAFGSFSLGYNASVPLAQRSLGVSYSGGVIYFKDAGFPRGGFLQTEQEFYNERSFFPVATLNAAIAHSQGMGVSFEHDGGEIALKFENWTYDYNRIFPSPLPPTFTLYKIG